MPHAKRYRRVVEEVASVSSDYLQTNWGAFDGGSHVIEPDGDTSDVGRATVTHDAELDALLVRYEPHMGRGVKRPVREALITLKRQPCRFGGSRVIFNAPCCGRPVRWLALLPERVACRQCGRLTYRCRRKSGLPAVVHRADMLAGRLGCESWYAPAKVRPRGMPKDTFARLAAKHDASVRAAVKTLQPRLAKASRRHGPFGGLMIMTRAGM